MTIESKPQKIIRSFTSEIIEILRDDPLLREIGIRGDCVYAIYTTPKKTDLYEVHNKAAYVNSFIAMLNRILRNHGLDTIRAGIGLAVGMTTLSKLVEKAWVSIPQFGLAMPFRKHQSFQDLATKTVSRESL